MPSGRIVPKRLDVGPASFLVFPSRVADGAVVQGVRQVVAVFGDAHAADVGAVGPHHIEIRRGLVFIVLVALERIAAPLGDKHDVAVGAVGRIQVAPLAAGQLPQGTAVGSDFKDVGRLFRASQLVTGAAIEPAGRRLVGFRLGVAEHNPVGIPSKIDAVNVARP